MSVIVDLKTRVFSEDERALRLFPGRGYRHFEVMRERSIVFLDFPGMPLPGGQGYEKDDATLAALARAEKLQNLVQSRGDSDEDISRAYVDDYSGSRWSQKRSLALGWLNALIVDARPGSLVIVPSPGLVQDENGKWIRVRSLIGEIAGDPVLWHREASDSRRAATFVARPVRWLAEFDEVDLSAETQQALRTQNAVISLRARAFERILGAAYKNIVVGDEFLARFVTGDDDFTAFESYHFNAFVMAVVAACRDAQQGKPEWSGADTIYGKAAEVSRNDELVPEQESSIHSPGYMTLRGSLVIPAVISSLFALAVACYADPTLSPFDPEGLASVSVVNTESEAFDPCEPKIDEAVVGALNIIGLSNWQEMCRAGANAHENNGLGSIATVSRAPGGR